MKLAIVGGDLRQVYAAELLAKRGHSVTVYRPAAPPVGIEIASTAHAACAAADAVLLPIPATGNGGVVRGTEALLPCELLPDLSPGNLLLGGNLSAALVSSARERGVRTVDYLNQESFVLENAYLTAQAALGILLSELPVCLYRTNVAILGFGRIGKFLSRMLRALGAEVTVFARRSSDLAMAQLIGVDTKPVSALSSDHALSFAEVIVNTAPARLLSSAHLSHLVGGTLLLELASGADNLPPVPEGSALRILTAQGLPGRCFPRSAGEIVADATEQALSLL